MSVFRFANPLYFQWLWFVLILIIVVYLLRKRFTSLIQKQLGKKTTPFLISSVSKNKRRWKFILQMNVLVFCIFALARPQSGQSEQKVKSEGIELMLLVDVSKSMLAEDVKPSRLELAKKELSRFLGMGSGDKVGLVAFAGSAVLLSPLTNDMSALNMFLEALSPDMVSSQGTFFKRALEMAAQSFKQGGVVEDEESVVTRAIVLVSDGEDNEKGALEAVESLKEKGVRVFTMAVGTEKGGAIPHRDSRGNLRGYLKDNDRKVVLTQTEGESLKRLSQASNAAFYHLTFAGDAVKNLREDIEKLQKSNFENASIVNYDEKYQLLLFFAIILALIELFLGDRKAAGRIWKGRFEVMEQ